MRWIPVEAYEGEQEYVDLDRVVKVRCYNYEGSLHVVLYVAGGGDALVAAGEVAEARYVSRLMNEMRDNSF